MAYKLQQIISEVFLSYLNSGAGAGPEKFRGKLDGFLKTDPSRKQKCYTCDNTGHFYLLLGR